MITQNYIVLFGIDQDTYYTEMHQSTDQYVMRLWPANPDGGVVQKIRARGTNIYTLGII